MAISAFNGQAQDLAGNAVTAFQVEVRDETTTNLAPIFSDLAGSTPLGNPFTPNPLDNGHFIFYAEQGRYRVRAFDGSGNVADWRNVVVGFDTTNLLEEDENLSDVDVPSTAFDNIKQPATTTATGVVEKATDAEVRSATADKYLDAALIESASAGVAITNQTPATWDWDAGINFTLTISQNTQIATPSNGQPGTWRTILVQGNDATDRTITFSGDFEGEIPIITDCDNGRWYLLMIFCVTTTHFVVSAKRANG
jgi:hypothetical protein